MYTVYCIGRPAKRGKYIGDWLSTVEIFFLFWDKLLSNKLQKDSYFSWSQRWAGWGLSPHQHLSASLCVSLYFSDLHCHPCNPKAGKTHQMFERRETSPRPSCSSGVYNCTPLFLARPTGRMAGLLDVLQPDSQAIVSSLVWPKANRYTKYIL